MNKIKLNYNSSFFLLCLIAQTTGKISGIVKDADTDEPLIAANVIVQGTAFGAATDLDGSYYIINIKARHLYNIGRHDRLQTTFA